MRLNKPTHIKVIIPQIIAGIARQRAKQNKSGNDSQKEKTSNEEALK